MRRPNRRCAYHCSILDMDNRPMFRIRVQENPDDEPVAGISRSRSAKAAWHKIVDEIDALRRRARSREDVLDLRQWRGSVWTNGTWEMLVQRPKFPCSFKEPHIIRLIESLPGVEMLQNYAFKYGRLQLLDMPLTLNPTGCARK